MAVTTTGTYALGSASCFATTRIGTFVTYDTIAAAFPSCNAMNSVYIGCNSLTSSALDSCICNQVLFNDIYGCENEWRICLDSNDGDSHAQDVLSNWHSQCDGIATPTTPPLTTLPASASLCPAQVIEQFEDACTAAVKAGNSCVARYPALSQKASYSSCVCQSSILSAVSVCRYDYAKTCFGRTPVLTEIGPWSYCPELASSLLAQQSNAMTGSDYTYTAPSTATPQPSPTASPMASPSGTASSGSTSRGGPSPTASTSSASGLMNFRGGNVWVLVAATIVAILFGI